MAENVEIMEILTRIEEKITQKITDVDMEGITRTTDPLGRLTIPKEYRKVMGITEDTQLKVCLVNGALIVKKI